MQHKRKSKSKKLAEKQRKLNQAEAVLLETSIQIKRIYGHKDEKKIIESQIGTKRRFISSFIYREYQRRIIVPLIDFYLDLKGEDSVRDAIDWFKETTYSSRELKVMIVFIEDLSANFIDNKSGALARLRFLIKESSEYFIRIVRGSIPNEIGLAWIEVPGINAPDEELIAFKEKVKCIGRCGQTPFWQHHKRDLDLFLSPEIDSHFTPKSDYDGFFDKKNLFTEIKTNPERADMYTRCLSLGDAVIATECPQDYRLYTTDKAFEVYCYALGKQQQRIPSLAEIRKIYHPL